MYSKEIAKWLLDEEEKVKDKGVYVLNVKWFSHDGSNDPQFVADIENATNMGRIEVWDTGDVLFSFYQDGAEDWVYEKVTFDSLEKGIKTIQKFIQKVQQI